MPETPKPAAVSGTPREARIAAEGDCSPTIAPSQFARDHAAFAAKHYAELMNLLHALGVHWGPDPRRTHLAVCQMRQRLAQEVRARDSATKREIIQEIRTRLCD